MVSQEEQEGWDFRKFQEEMLIDFSLFEEEFLAQSTLDDHAQQQQQQQHLQLELELTLDDIIASLNDEPPIPPPPPPPSQQVNVRSDFAADVAASERSSNPKRRMRKRRKGYSPEQIELRAMAKERQKIKNREIAAKIHAKKQKYVKDLELQYEDLCRENALSKRVLKFLEIRMEVGILPRKLARTTSDPIPIII